MSELTPCDFCGDEATAQVLTRDVCADCAATLADLLAELLDTVRSGEAESLHAALQAICDRTVAEAFERPPLTDAEANELLDQIEEATWPVDVQLGIEALPCTTDSEAAG